LATFSAASNMLRLTMASWVGWDDQTHASGGFVFPLRLRARRFQTMYPA
jgi:hypothetical protein